MDRLSSNAETPVQGLTSAWGDWGDVSLYLDRCQVDTPTALVQATWAHVRQRRVTVRKVVDFGAGDGRFAYGGGYKEYVGYEIDPNRSADAKLPPGASLINECAFAHDIHDADLCIGNPPFVRNQDLPLGWRRQAAEKLRERTGVAISGLANAWQYFFLLALASTRPDGLCALVVPFEWVSRPSVRPLRRFIREAGWSVAVYRLVDSTFDSVLTTASITLIDKANVNGSWFLFEEEGSGRYRPLPSAGGSEKLVVPYLTRAEMSRNQVWAKRGLSPGNQKALVLTEAERRKAGLLVTDDVVPCVTSLRFLPQNLPTLDAAAFDRFYRRPGRRCWLIRTDVEPSGRLAAYLGSVPAAARATSTCRARDQWWRFQMPEVPAVLAAQSYKGPRPKVVSNGVRARAVGAATAIFGATQDQVTRLLTDFAGLDFEGRIVAHANGLKKLETSQLNSLLREAFGLRPEGGTCPVWTAAS